MKKYLSTIFFSVVFVSIFIIYYVSSAGETPHDYFTRLGNAFLAGKFYLTENPPWLNELIPSGKEIFFVVYPPMPGILAIPFLLFFGQDFPQDYLAYLIGAATSLITMAISWNIKKDLKLSLFSGIMIGLGSIVWFMSSVGSSWYLGQITSTLFLSLALLESLTKKRGALVGIFLGASYLSRLQTILSLPLFLYLLKDKNWKRNYILLFLGIVPFVLFNFFYNYVRFGVIWDIGYTLIPGVMSEPWYERGLFHTSNILSHIKVIFASFPKLINTFPYIVPSLGGLSIWITTPLFIYSLFAGIKERVVQVSWLSILLISTVVFSHGTTGFSQFGYRFALDFYPILTFLTIKGLAKSKKLNWFHWLLLFVSVIINAWGVIVINKLGIAIF